VSFCIICASIKWCSSALSPSDSSMHIGSIDVAPGPICPLTRQRRLLLLKNSTVNVRVVPMSWIIVCKNYIFTLYVFPSKHSEDDECGGDLTAVMDRATNKWRITRQDKTRYDNTRELRVLLIHQLVSPTLKFGWS
jgi:hypothetical protein